jgi:Oxidoreductase family, NAD-binding Rossmann fold
MGKTHSFGFAVATRVFDLPYEVEMRTLADVSKPQAEAAASALGFMQATSDWRTLVADPNIDVVDITAPNALHKEIALAAIAAGKHVYCEKPLAPRASEAREMAEAAESAGVKTQVGFNYLCNPMIACARDMVAGGELGEVRSYRAVHAEDYMADASSPFTFRHDPVGGGALADIGSHALATAEFLLGPISRRAAPSRSTTSDGPFCASRMARQGQSRRTGSPPAERCSTTLRSMGPKARLFFPRSGLTNCVSTQAQIRRAERASAGSRLAQTNHPTVGSAWRRAISSGSTISKRSRTQAISMPSPVGVRNPSIFGWVFAFKPSLRRSKNRRRQRAGWMSKMAGESPRRGDGVSVSLQATKVAEAGGAEARVANLPGKFHNSWLIRQSTLHSKSVLILFSSEQRLEGPGALSTRMEWARGQIRE